MLAADVSVDHFSYGPVTPVLGFLMAMLGGALGLRCTVRALSLPRRRRAGWLALGALALGNGIFTMHFIAMMGFTVTDVKIGYDLALTYASLLIAVLVVGLGVFLVGYARRPLRALVLAGPVTGLGVAAMHYVGMAGMDMRGGIRYDTAVVVLSVLIAVVAATAALWFAISVQGFGAALGASLIMGFAVSGMHYTAMWAVDVHVHEVSGFTGRSPVTILMPILIVPLLLLLMVGLFVGLDPMAVQERRRDTAGTAEAVPEPRAAWFR